MKNQTKKDWKVVYTDMYGDPLTTIKVEDLTADEVVQYAEDNWPMDRAIEDYTVEQLKAE